MRKKTLAMVLTACMMMAPVSAFAADATEEAAAETTEAAGEATDSEIAEGLGMIFTVSAWSLTVR